MTVPIGWESAGVCSINLPLPQFPECQELATVYIKVDDNCLVVDMIAGLRLHGTALLRWLNTIEGIELVEKSLKIVTHEAAIPTKVQELEEGYRVLEKALTKVHIMQCTVRRKRRRVINASGLLEFGWETVRFK